MWKVCWKISVIFSFYVWWMLKDATSVKKKRALIIRKHNTNVAKYFEYVNSISDMWQKLDVLSRHCRVTFDDNKKLIKHLRSFKKLQRLNWKLKKIRVEKIARKNLKLRTLTPQISTSQLQLAFKSALMTLFLMNFLTLCSFACWANANKIN